MAAPVYLFTGPEFGERNDQVAAVKASLKKKFGDSDEFLLYASDVRIVDIIAQLQMESLFVPAKCIVLREAELIKKKDDIELLSNWIKTATSMSSILILVSDEISVDSKLEKLIPKENKKIFWEMFEDRKEEWIKNYFRKNGLNITPDACASILEMIENNTEALKAECNRFFLCFQKDHVITPEDVEQILAHNREESAFTLFDAMADYSTSAVKRLENSLSILQKILMTKTSASGGAVMLIAGLTSCFRKLNIWHQLHAAGSYPDEISLKAGGFSSKKSRAQYSKASQIWNQKHVAAIIALLSETDMDIRSTGMSLQTTQLYILLYEIIMKNGASCSKYEV